MREKLDPMLWGDLKRLHELEILGSGEIMVERELVGLGTAPGMLLVTNRRVIYFRASPVSDKTTLVSVPMLEIVDVEVSERRSPIKKRGVLSVRSNAVGEAELVTFEYIAGGRARAEEISRAIVRQRDQLVDESRP